MVRSVMLVAVLCGFPAQTVMAADWSGFRGSHGNGISSAGDLPLEWDGDTNIAWKIALPGQSNGSPAVVGEHVYLTSAENEGRDRHLHCFRTGDGSQQWTKTVHFEEQMETHATNQYAASTPAATEDRVVVWHGSAGLFCYSMAGEELWNCDLGDFRHKWGYGTSPVIDHDRVLLHSGPGEDVFVAAINLQNGDLLWKTSEPKENTGPKNPHNKNRGSWSTPVIVTINNRRLVVCSLATRVNAYDQETGEIVWTCHGVRGQNGDLAYASTVIADDLCIAMGGYKGPSFAIRMDGSGDVTDSHVLWRRDVNPQRIGSGVYLDGYVYQVNAGPNILQCVDPRTGDVQWKQRGIGAAFWGSLIYADGRFYALDQKGNTVVFAPNPKQFQRLAVNRLNDPGNATPAVTDGAIYIRTFAHLYRISK